MFYTFFTADNHFLLRMMMREYGSTRNGAHSSIDKSGYFLSAVQ